MRHRMHSSVQSAFVGLIASSCFIPCSQLPVWYDMWWDNGVFPGQPAVDYMFGPLPSNLTEVRGAALQAAPSQLCVQ